MSSPVPSDVSCSLAMTSAIASSAPVVGVSLVSFGSVVPSSTLSLICEPLPWKDAERHASRKRYARHRQAPMPLSARSACRRGDEPDGKPSCRSTNRTKRPHETQCYKTFIGKASAMPSPMTQERTRQGVPVPHDWQSPDANRFPRMHARDKLGKARAQGKQRELNARQSPAVCPTGMPAT